MGNKQGKSRAAAPPKPPAKGAAKPKLYIADGCPYVLKTLIFVAEARLQDHIEFVPDSPAAREHVTKLIGAPASFPALERPDGSCMQFPEEDKIIATLAEEFGVDLEQMHVLDAYRSGVFPRYKMMMGKLMASPEVAGVWPKLFPAIGVRKVTVLGATGMVGSRLVTEAKHRGHVVSAPSSRTGDRVDVSDSAAVAAALEGQEIVICAVGPRAKMVMGNPPKSEDGPGPVLLEKVKAVVAGAAQAKVQRVLFVGGAGTLNLPGGAGKLAAADFFPEFVRPTAAEHQEVLDWLVSQGGDAGVQWTVLTPPGTIEPGVRTGNYALGDDEPCGQKVSAEDYAVAALDELEAGEPKYINKRFTVATKAE